MLQRRLIGRALRGGIAGLCAGIVLPLLLMLAGGVPAMLGGSIFGAMRGLSDVIVPLLLGFMDLPRTVLMAVIPLSVASPLSTIALPTLGWIVAGAALNLLALALRDILPRPMVRESS